MKKVFESIENEIATLEENYEFIYERKNKKDINVLFDLRHAISKLSKELDLQLYKLALFKDSIFCLSYLYKFKVSNEFLDERNAVVEHIKYVNAKYDSVTRSNYSKNSENLEEENLWLSVNDLKQYGTRLDSLYLKLNEQLDKMLSEDLEN